MKSNLLSKVILASFFAILLGACSTDDTADITINNYGGGTTDPSSDTIYLSGYYTSDLTLDANKTYVINGSLVMASGTTLTIPAGMTIEAQSGPNVYVAISQGAMIDAQGTANEPIVFTSNQNSPAAGDWGGLILLGKAPINSVIGGNTTSTSEVGQLAYGGSIANDNSGTLAYVRVEYSGGSADGQTENNGISFYGVGNGTSVSHVQVYAGKDDGVEFFGGTVNVNNIIIVNAEDDSVDWTEGYSGTLTDVYIKHGANHDKGVEADGFNTDIGNNSSPVFWSKPTVTNLTIVGLGSGNGNEAVRLRAGTQGIFSNVVLEGFDEGFDLDDMQTGTGVINDDLQVTDVTFTDITLEMKNDTGASFTAADFYTGNGNGTATDVMTWGASWAVGL